MKLYLNTLSVYDSVNQLINSQVYFLKHSRLSRLGTLGFRYSLFQLPPVEKRFTGSFFSVVYRLRIFTISGWIFQPLS